MVARWPHPYVQVKLMLNAKTCMDTASVPKREEDVSLIFSRNIFPWDISLIMMNHWTLHAVRGRGGSTWWRRRARSTLGLLQNPAAGAFVKNGLIKLGFWWVDIFRPWVYGQFSPTVLPAVCHLLHTAPYLRPAERSNPVKVSALPLS